MIDRPPPALIALKWCSILAFLTALGIIASSAWTRLDATTRALQANGWARAVGTPPRAPDQFTLRCIADAKCSTALQDYWVRIFPNWVLYLPLVGLTGLVAVRVLQNRRPRKDPGEARWATRKDMKPYLGEKPGRVGYLGLLEGKHVVRLPENSRCAHTLVIGGTGAGKTTRYVNPNLLLDARDGVSAVVFDLKYPDPKSGFLDTINYFKAWGRGVYPFTPFDPDSVRVPLIADVKTVQEALSVAEAFRPSGGKEEESGAFYRNSERQLLAGLILGVAQEPEPSMKRIFDLLGGGADGLKTFAKERPYLKSLLGTILELRADMITGIATGLMGDLLAFTNPNLNRATSSGDGQVLDLEALCSAPGFLYIGLPQEEIQGGQGQVLLRLIKRVLDKAILAVCARNGGRLPVHLSIYLDEFPSFGPIPNIAENLATMRSRRVAYHIAMQNLAQGQAVYGKEEFAGMINNNFAQMVVFPRSLRLEDATFFSEIFGEMTVLEESFSRTRSGGPLFANPLGEVKRMQGAKAAKRALLSAEAMRTFPDGNAVIETIGSPPATVRMPRLDERDNPYRKLYLKISSAYSTPQLRKPGVSSDPAPSLELTAPPEAAAQTRNPLAETFRAWFEGLLEAKIPLQADVEEGKPVHVSFRRSDLSALPDDVPEWVGKGWLEVNDSSVVVPRLGLSRVTRLHKTVVQRSSEAAPAKAKPTQPASGKPVARQEETPVTRSAQVSREAPSPPEAPKRAMPAPESVALTPQRLESPSASEPPAVSEPPKLPKLGVAKPKVKPVATDPNERLEVSVSRPPRLGTKAEA
jgi:type IV secretion system protein VirD4